jgi:hypothetical protein
VFRIEVAIGGRVIGVGEGHSRRVAETGAAAQAIDTLRAASGPSSDGSPDAPELAEFDSLDVEDGPEGGGGAERGSDADGEPWIEVSVDTPDLAAERRVADGEAGGGRAPSIDKRSAGESECS